MVQLVEIATINIIYSPTALLRRASYSACCLKIKSKEVTVICSAYHLLSIVGKTGMVLEPAQASRVVVFFCYLNQVSLY